MKRMSKTLAQVHKVSCLISLQQFIALLTSVFSRNKRYTSISLTARSIELKRLSTVIQIGNIQKGSTEEELKNMVTSLHE
jgi:DNA-binding TFAR19-related protein (PDSD5 family)